MGLGAHTSASVGYSDNAPTVAVPSGAVAGDLFILVIQLGRDDVGNITWPAGFVEVASSARDSAVTITGMFAAIKVANGTESGNFVAATSFYQGWKAACAVISGFSAPEDDSSASATYGYSATATHTGEPVSTSQGGCGIVWMAATISTGGTPCVPSVTTPSGFSAPILVDFELGNSIALAFGIQASAGSASYSGQVDFGEVADGRVAYLITLALPPVDAPPEGAILEANVLGSATVTADLYAPGPVSGLAAQVLGSATVTAALTTAITLQASVLGRASVRAKLDGTGSTSIFLQSTAVQPLATGPWIPSPWFSSST